MLLSVRFRFTVGAAIYALTGSEGLVAGRASALNRKGSGMMFSEAKTVCGIVAVSTLRAMGNGVGVFCRGYLC